METLELYNKGQVLAVFQTSDRPVEIGRAMGCDVTVDDPQMAERQFLVTRRRGALVVYDVSCGKRGQARPLPLNCKAPLCRDYELVRRPSQNDQGRVRSAPDTAALDFPDDSAARLCLQVGSGPGSRRFLLSDKPLHIGRDQDNDIVIRDRAVSRFHCRLEPYCGVIMVRDLQSENGTYVDGVRVERAVLRPGTGLRLGRTELRLLDRDRFLRAPDGRMLIAASSAMTQVLDDLQRLANVRWPVLIHGETGTGKEGAAFALHAQGSRSQGPFVTLNAGGVSPHLVESELFGHERGAFTGALQQHRGVFEQAQHGTLFLDEVGELPLASQARLLRVLENGEVRRVGGTSVVQVDVRLVCATHRDLRAMIEQGEFREDLYYRIARLVVEIPPLRERQADIPALCEHFLAAMVSIVGPKTLSSGALKRMDGHLWKGNVRELRNVLETAATRCSGYVIEADDIEHALTKVSGHRRKQVEPGLVQAVLEANHSNLSAAARMLGIPRNTLRDRLRKQKQGAA